MLDMLKIWLERIRARRALALMDERSLRDLGISPAFVDFELRKPFWKELADWRS